MPGPVLLCADDYALTEGVSRAIEDLAAARRLSATSALVTTRHWPSHGRRVGDLSNRIAVGLHLNLTLGTPLGPMPELAPSGLLPPIGTLVQRALLGRIDPSEVRQETARQIARFREVADRDPDFLDGHQHAHALPGIRTGVLDAIAEAFPGGGFLVRDPADTIARITARQAAVAKSLLLAGLAIGFGAQARARGCVTNEGFSGVSAFDRRSPYESELRRFLSQPGPRHLVMCHPGYPDAELAAVDPVVERRQDESDVIRSFPDLESRLWRPSRCGGPAWDNEPFRVAAA